MTEMRILCLMPNRNKYPILQAKYDQVYPIGFSDACFTGRALARALPRACPHAKTDGAPASWAFGPSRGDGDLSIHGLLVRRVVTGVHH
jgi:hypothetical protein